ncbi:uncharacterized protein LOC106175477 [Lingula anatina]|uniref:Uncharacterized protein LOC106175477 n=1 Tax=Lingula anatina TaxID=7574 RepID=A0A1S3JS76_LINAN|nr:uncharacterized protein LOC106175477 [Lingula anatina]|eukprot:XP_013412961.1 uncharacterized protein LOC106175477 [Lingula anatina]
MALSYVNSPELAFKVIEEYEIKTNSQFVHYSGPSPKRFGSSDWKVSNKKIRWQQRTDTSFGRLEFDGVPFMTYSELILDCRHGPDRNKALKAKLAAAKAKKIEVDSKNARRNQSTKLRNDIMNGKDVVAEKRIYVYLPDETEHTNHPVGKDAGFHQQLDHRVIEHIQHLVAEGVTDPQEMRRHIEIYVKGYPFQLDGEQRPDRSNRRFYPSIVDIRGHMYRALVKLRFSKIDQENFRRIVESWKDNSDDSFFFRPYKKRLDIDFETANITDDTFTDDITINQKTSEERLLFVHQTQWQKRLLSTYGNELFLLDATYRVTKYSLPLFFLVVRTNVDYQVVASFVIQDETTEAISEALAMVKSWNPSWQPKNAMTDNCDEEIKAIESVLPGCSVLLCDFHREQAWLRWLRKSSNGMSEKRAEILARFRKIAQALTEVEYHAAVADLKRSRVWQDDKSKKLRQWFEGTWLKVHKRWVKAFRAHRLLSFVNTNNGVERQNRTFKYNYLRQCSRNSLSTMVKVLVERFLPDRYKEGYIKKNNTYAGYYRKYDATVPSYLQNRPEFFTKHCMGRIASASYLEDREEAIFVVGPGKYQIQSETKHGYWHTFTFGTGEVAPSCTCQDWQLNGLPCKHLFGLLCFKGESWDQLPANYRNSPFFTIDEEVLFKSTKITPNNTDPGNYEVHVNVPSSNLPEIPTPMFPKQTELSQCHDLLAQIKSKTYLVTDGEAIRHTNEKLKTILQKLQESISNESGVDLRPSPAKKRRLQLKKKPGTKPEAKECVQSHLPIRPGKRCVQSGRVGHKAEMMKRQNGINLALSGDTVECHVVQEEQVLDNFNCQEPIVLTSSAVLSSRKAPKAKSSMPTSSVVQSNHRSTTVHSTKSNIVTPSFKKNTIFEESIKPSVIYKDSNMESTNITLGKYKSHHITYDSISSINGMLTDEVIDSYLDLISCRSAIGKKYYEKKEGASKFTFFNSLGETRQEKEVITRNWGNFSRMKDITCQYVTIDHDKQQDGYTCGLWCIHAVEHLLKYGLSKTPRISQPDFLALRLNVATLILRNIVVADKRQFKVMPVGQKIKLTFE